MKKLEIIIRPSKMDDVKNSLAALGIHGMTYTETRGFGRQMGHKEVYRGATYTVDFVTKIKLELVVHDEAVDKVLEAVLASARTGNIGDGKIFILPVENAIRIRTGETGDDAL